MRALLHGDARVRKCVQCSPGATLLPPPFESESGSAEQDSPLRLLSPQASSVRLEAPSFDEGAGSLAMPANAETLDADQADVTDGSRFELAAAVTIDSDPHSAEACTAPGAWAEVRRLSRTCPAFCSQMLTVICRDPPVTMTNAALAPAPEQAWAIAHAGRPLSALDALSAVRGTCWDEDDEDGAFLSSPPLTAAPSLPERSTPQELSLTPPPACQGTEGLTSRLPSMSSTKWTPASEHGRIEPRCPSTPHSFCVPPHSKHPQQSG